MVFQFHVGFEPGNTHLAFQFLAGFARENTRLTLAGSSFPIRSFFAFFSFHFCFFHWGFELNKRKKGFLKLGFVLFLP